VKQDADSQPAPAPSAPETPSAERPSADVALIHSATADGRGLNVVRFRDGVLSAGAVRQLEPGKPIHGEVVRLKPRPNLPRVCDVEVQYSAEPIAAGDRKGPAQVATDSYRSNWDAIFSRRSSKPELSN
jgi:hypothetical protein